MEIGAHGLKAPEGLGVGGIFETSHDVDMEEIFEGSSFHGAGFQMGHVHAAIEEIAQYMVKGARFMAYGEDEGDFVGLFGDFHLWPDDEESRVVAGVEENIFRDHFQAIEAGRRFTGYGSLVFLPVFCHLFRAP